MSSLLPFLASLLPQLELPRARPVRYPRRSAGDTPSTFPSSTGGRSSFTAQKDNLRDWTGALADLSPHLRSPALFRPLPPPPGHLRAPLLTRGNFPDSPLDIVGGEGGREARSRLEARLVGEWSPANRQIVRWLKETLPILSHRSMFVASRDRSAFCVLLCDRMEVLTRASQAIGRIWKAVLGTRSPPPKLTPRVSFFCPVD